MHAAALGRPGEPPATVDELVLLAVVLDVTPADLISFVPEDAPLSEHPLATGVPGDVDTQELRAWLENRTALDHGSGVRWAEDRVARLEIRATHLEDELRGALEELGVLGRFALQEADAPPVVRLHDRIHEGEHALSRRLRPGSRTPSSGLNSCRRINAAPAPCDLLDRRMSETARTTSPRGGRSRRT